MKIRITTIFTALILAVATVYGQTYEPLDLAKKIFAKEGFSDIADYSKGEYAGSPNGQNLENDLTTKFTLLEQNEKNAVVGMTILDPLGKGFDTYLHFEKDTTWKMTAFRALAMTKMIEQIKAELEKMTPQQVDKVIAESNNNKQDSFIMFSSREDYNFQLGNATLILELDENIEKHFLANQKEFERLKNLALEQFKKEERTINIALIEHLQADYNKLFISSVSAGNNELGNAINFLIGGILDNSVGYLYVLDKKDLPHTSPNGIIMLREIGHGWYIYKTT